MNPHIYFLSHDFPSGRGESYQRKLTENLALITEGFSIHKVKIFFFKSEISLSILRPSI